MATLASRGIHDKFPAMSLCPLPGGSGQKLTAVNLSWTRREAKAAIKWFKSSKNGQPLGPGELKPGVFGWVPKQLGIPKDEF